MQKWINMIAGAFVVAIVLNGCGGSDGGTTGTAGKDEGPSETPPTSQVNRDYEDPNMVSGLPEVPMIPEMEE